MPLLGVKIAYAAATELYLTSYYNDANLISYYRMEDASDSKGSNTLTAVGTPSSVTAKFNNGYSYDGSSYHHTNSNMGINGGAVTISGWVKLNSRPGSGSTWYMASQFNSSSKVEYDFWFTNTSGTYSVSVNRGKSGVSDNPVSTNFDLGTTSYHFLALTYDGTYLRGYLDGESFGSLATSGSGSGGSVNDFVLGAAYNGTSKADAVWDDMAVFSRALSAGEIAELYGITATTRAIQDLSFTYDSNGNITQLAESASTSLERILTYGYDDLNRLTSASTTRATTTPYRYTYTYDSLGNMLSRNENGTTTTYTYATNTPAYLNPHAAATVGNYNYTYDNNGNLLSVAVGTSTPVSSYTWDYNNRMTESVVGGATSTYGYDHNGQRVKMSDGTATTIYPSKYYNTDGTTPTKHIFLPDGTMIATIVGTGTSTIVSYIHTDHLGMSNVATNDSGEVVQLVDQYPYGTFRIDEQNGFNEQRKGISGHEYDSNSSLTYMNSRYFNGTNAKFISQDPMFWNPDKNLSDPQMLNSYSYARNNPLAYIDPNGGEPVKAYAGTVSDFTSLLNNSNRKVGSYTGNDAKNYMLSLGTTQTGSWKQLFRPTPAQTGYFNNKVGRYIYTESGGWIDMTHFMFYAGRAYEYKEAGSNDPMGRAVQDGYIQEFADRFVDSWSAYSYEDLPSDRYGADFAVNHFDPNSDMTFSEQLNKYLESLGATDPQNAPNYQALPQKDEKNKPMYTNHTTKPVNLKSNDKK